MAASIAVMVAVEEVTGRVVTEGDQVTNFRGEAGIFEYATRPRVPGKSGKVLVNGWESYDKVWGLTVSALLDCGCTAAEWYDGGHREVCTVRD
jgi:hypothetical protein